MKIAFVSIINLKNIGGVRSYVEGLSSAMKANGNSVKSISLANLPLQKHIKNSKISDPNAEKISAYMGAAKVVKWLYFLKSMFWKPDIVLFQDVISYNTLATIAIKQGAKVALTAHTYLADEAVANKFINEGSRTHKYLLDEEAKAYKSAETIITVDKRIKKYIVDNFKINENKVFDFINFTDTERFKPINKTEARNILGWPTDEKIIVCPRKLNIKNGVIYAAKAAKEVELKDFKLYFCGDGEVKGEIQKIISEDKTTDKVKLLGDINPDKMPYVYSAADYMVVPSITVHGMEEATSIATLEAQACEKVVIASNVGGLKQIIETNRTGVLVEQKSPKEIAKSVERLDKDPELKIKIEKNARKYVKENCSNHSRSLDILKLFQS